MNINFYINSYINFYSKCFFYERNLNNKYSEKYNILRYSCIIRTYILIPRQLMDELEGIEKL